MNGHTKAPWRLTATEHDDIAVVSSARRDSQPSIAIVPLYDDSVVDGSVDAEQRANARLIAAAPEMYEALVQIAKGEGPYSRDELTHAANTIDAMKALAQTVLAKLAAPTPSSEPPK